jgi:hypothetical protein
MLWRMVVAKSEQPGEEEDYDFVAVIGAFPHLPHKAGWDINNKEGLTRAINDERGQLQGGCKKNNNHVRGRSTKQKVAEIVREKQEAGSASSAQASNQGNTGHVQTIFSGFQKARVCSAADQIAHKGTPNLPARHAPKS